MKDHTKDDLICIAYSQNMGLRLDLQILCITDMVEEYRHNWKILVENLSYRQMPKKILEYVHVGRQATERPLKT